MLSPRLLVDFGAMRHSITIKARSSQPDEYGQVDTTWTTVTTARASKRSLSLKETYQANMLSSQVTSVFEMRYQPSVTIRAGMRVHLGSSEVHEIQSVDDPDGRHMKLLLYCIDVTNSVSTS
jgi:SPP1 family predicted phage head-tail adaptor